MVFFETYHRIANVLECDVHVVTSLSNLIKTLHYVQVKQHIGKLSKSKYFKLKKKEL